MRAATADHSKTSVPGVLVVLVALVSFLFVVLSMHSLEISPAQSAAAPGVTLATAMDTVPGTADDMHSVAQAEQGALGIIGCATLGLVCSAGLLALAANRRLRTSRPAGSGEPTAPPRTSPLVATARSMTGAVGFGALGVLRT